MKHLTPDEAKEFIDYLFDDGPCLECDRIIEEHSPGDVKRCYEKWRREIVIDAANGVLEVE